MEINEKILEIDRTIRHLEDLIKHLKAPGGMTGHSGGFIPIDTTAFLRITLETNESFMPSVLNKKYEFRVAQNIALPIVENEIKKLKQDRENLTGNWFIRTFSRKNY